MKGSVLFLGLFPPLPTATGRAASCSPSSSSSQELLQPEPWLSRTWGPGTWGQPDGHSQMDTLCSGVTSAGQLEQS
ncbi:hypothetical protein Nmel_014526 [Mimus melanotis]